MLQGGTGGVTVDLLLSGYRLFGVTYQVNAENRLGDVLNTRSETLTLKHASIMTLRGQVLASLPEIVIHKRQLIAAIPKESAELQHQARLYRAGMSKPTLARVPVLALVPPFAFTGRVHIPLGSDVSDPDHSGLARFFPITDAVVIAGEERIFQGEVVLVNRDLVAMLGKTGEATIPQPAPQPQVRDDALMDVIAALNEQVRR